MSFAQLPTELQIEIFGYLERLDLKAARGVSRKFRDHTSPSLFQNVVACARYKALSAMQKVSLHPVYQTYVKELIFDGSVYDSALASRFERYQAQADQCDAISTGFRWENMARYKRYQLLYREQEDMRTGGILFQEVSRALESMTKVSSLVYSPGPRNIPIEAKDMKDILPRGAGKRWGLEAESSYASFLDSCQHGIHHVIGAIYASQYSRIREFRVEAPGVPATGTEFTIFVFDFADQQHLEAGRYFFRQLHRLKMNISLRHPGTLDNAINGNALPHPSSASSLTQVSNLSTLLLEAKDLRELSFHLTHWQPSAHHMYGHLNPHPQRMFIDLGLNARWHKLRSLSLGGIHATEEELMQLITRHRETLKDVEFSHCSLFSGLWANIVDEVIHSTSIFPFSLKRVNEAVIEQRNFQDLTAEEMEHWQYEGTLMLNSGGLRYFDEPYGKTVYSSQRLSTEEN